MLGCELDAIVANKRSTKRSDPALKKMVIHCGGDEPASYGGRLASKIILLMHSPRSNSSHLIGNGKLLHGSGVN